MMPFRRQPEPSFWEIKERRWQELAPNWGDRDPLNDWRHQTRSLASWFHELVRDASEPRMRAYCDGSLQEQSRETIDHFLPKHEFPEVALCWTNLFPACDRCNSAYKRERWSCRLVRPDTDPVDELFDFDEQSGRLRPRANLDWPMRVNVRLTIRLFRLNQPHRCEGRKRVWRAMQRAWKRDAPTLDGDDSTLKECIDQGPYRFVARRCLLALQALDASYAVAPPSKSPG
jgi:uncharacterized protein (TIGR02646 family)